MSAINLRTWSRSILSKPCIECCSQTHDDRLSLAEPPVFSQTMPLASVDFADVGEVRTMCSGEEARENLKAPDGIWRVHFIKEDFHRLMFEPERN